MSITGIITRDNAEEVKKLRKYVTELTKVVDVRLYIKGITRRELAERVGIGYQHLNNMLVSRSLPSAKVSSVIAEAIGENPEKLRKLILKCYEARRAEGELKSG